MRYIPYTIVAIIFFSIPAFSQAQVYPLEAIMLSNQVVASPGNNTLLTNSKPIAIHYVSLRHENASNGYLTCSDDTTLVLGFSNQTVWESDWPTDVIGKGGATCSGNIILVQNGFFHTWYYTVVYSYVASSTATSSPGFASTSPFYTQDSGNLSFALSLIIVILSIALTAFMYNKITSKKPWLH